MAKSTIAKQIYGRASSRRGRSARTLLLRMARDQARADRIRQLKLDHPELTWQAVGDYVGVTGRAAQAWQEKGGIAYENAKKLAELFEVDVNYIMKGDPGTAPDLMAELGDSVRLLEIEQTVKRIEALLLPGADDAGRADLDDAPRLLRALAQRIQDQLPPSSGEGAGAGGGNGG